MDLDELIARSEILDVVARYARGVDRGDWDAVRSCYHPEAHDDHGVYCGGVDGLMEVLVALAGELGATTHQLGNHLVEVAGSTARAETYCLAWYRRTGRGGVERSIAQGLRYLDHFERRERWAIIDRIVVLDWEQVFAPGPVPAIAPGWQRGARGADDPSERWRSPDGAPGPLDPPAPGC